MALDESTSDILCGRLLLAAPDLLEPTFRRTVLLITNHTATDGALGYILNRPLRKMVSDLLPSSPYPELEDVPVFVGGPVSQEHLTFSALGWNNASGTLQYQTHLSAEDAARSAKEGFSVRAYVGYSGWSEGQLENELKERAWVVSLPRRVLMQVDKLNTSLWGEFIRDVSPMHRLAADMPDDVSLN